MILQALQEYYERMAADPESGIAPEGWVQGGIDFLIELDPSGEYVQIQSLQETNGKKLMSKPMLVPSIGKQAIKHTNSGQDANLLWDNSSFVLGLGEKGDLRLKSMIETINHWFVNDRDSEIDAVKIFLEKGLVDRTIFNPIQHHKEYGEIISSGQPKISFHIKGSENRIIFQSKIVGEILARFSLNVSSSPYENPKGTCLVSGQQNIPIELTHTAIKGVWGAQTSGAYIVGFNKESFNSYRKEQGQNAPINKKIASEYVKSLNFLLDSEQKLKIGDASTIFWSKKRTQFESDFISFFKEPDKDSPAKGIEKIKNLFNAPITGGYLDDDSDTTFYILGLSPNAARIAVRFWQVGTVSEFARKIRQHFEDLNIVKPASEPQYYSIWRILVNIAIQDKSENIPPNLAGDFMRSILDGTPYPETLLQAALRRIRNDTEHRVKPVRAAIIKAYLNRYLRIHPDGNEKEVEMGLDTEQPSIGYQLGRLFAVLEKVQEEASPGLNATIRERYYGAACSSPVTVFGTLMRLKNHHIVKIDNKGRAINLERLIGSIVSRIDDFPSHLDLHEQGRFALGYYHQRQDFFTKRDSE